MDHKVELRAAAEDEAAEIAALLARSWRENYAELLGGYRTERLVAEYCRVGRISAEIGAAGAGDGWLGWLVARSGGELAGAAAGGITTIGSGEIYTLCTAAAHGRRGIATALIGAATEQQRARGATEQWVGLYGPEDPTFGFFTKHGFTPVQPAESTAGRSAARPAERSADPAEYKDGAPALVRIRRAV
ncbi:GNAT family N-acetyltransferase [Kitasatospora sp. GP82]|uniref:GNAT family N-acetyltransferase n=1 Tax=Kitasatospora sp. GP82 TaxID=3035089 RepID=UPI00247700B2|nr:GNAT family N-acetyltransferase [Kitasatospora sp. GP82]MDH6125699.1 ribosomal protein S18 acetylase RimI-like enzyme [Kitasatospora sp. GP82]